MKSFLYFAPTLLTLSLSYADSVKETSVSLPDSTEAAPSPVPPPAEHWRDHNPARPVVAINSDSLGQVVLQDVTGDILGFLQNVGDQTKATMGKLVDGIQYAVGYAGGVLDGILHGRVNNLTTTTWLSPLANMVAVGSNLMVRSLTQSSDPSSLVDAEKVQELVSSLHNFQSLAVSFGVRAVGLDKAIADLSNFAQFHLHRRDPLFVDIDSVVVGHFKPNHS